MSVHRKADSKICLKKIKAIGSSIDKILKEFQRKQSKEKANRTGKGEGVLCFLGTSTQPSLLSSACAEGVVFKIYQQYMPVVSCINIV